jgi:hypothetical protein
MDPILRRSLIWYLLHLMTYSGILGRYLVVGSWQAFEIIPLFMPVWLISSVVWSEREESYAFLRVLPITDRSIVRTKFMLILSITVVYWLLMEGVTLARQGSGVAGGPSTLTFITLACVYALLLGACFQVGYWRFGASVVTPVGVVYMGLNLALAIIHNASFRFESDWPILAQSAAIRWLSDSLWLSHLVLVALALLAFYGLMRIGFRIKTSSEACL